LVIAKPEKPKTFHEDFQEITDQIKRFESMQVENYAQIRKLQRENKALKETIEQLKTKRRQIAFLSTHIAER